MKNGLIVILIILDMFLCYLLWESNHNEAEFEGKTLDCSTALDFAYSSFYSFNLSDIEEVLVDYSLHDVLVQEDACYLFIPKNPCDVCISRQLEYIETVVPETVHFVIISPEHRWKQIRASLGMEYAKDVISYNPDCIELRNSLFDGYIVFFSIKDKRVNSFHIANPNYPKATIFYLNNL